MNIFSKDNKNKLLRIGKHQGAYFFAVFIYSAIPLLFLPVLTRYLAPSEYANISIFRFYMAIANTLIGSSISVIISKYFFKRDKTYIANLIGNSIVIIFAITLLISIIIYIFNDFFVQLINIPLFWILVIPWTSSFYIIFAIGLTVMRNQKKPKVFVKHKIGNSLINIFISSVLVVVFIYGWQGRILGIVFSFFIAALLSLYYLNKNSFLAFNISYSQIKKILKLFLPLVPNALQPIIIGQIGIFFMQYYYNKDLLGIYSVGFQISFAIKLLFIAISMSWSPFVYEQLSKQNMVKKIKLARNYYLLALILISGVAFIIIFSDIILKIISTPAYYDASKFIPWFAFGFFFIGMSIFIQPILILKEKHKYISMVSIANMILLIFSNILLIKLFGYIGIAMAFTISAFIQFFLYVFKAQIVFPLPWIKSLSIKNF